MVLWKEARERLAVLKAVWDHGSKYAQSQFGVTNTQIQNYEEQIAELMSVVKKGRELDGKRNAKRKGPVRQVPSRVHYEHGRDPNVRKPLHLSPESFCEICRFVTRFHFGDHRSEASRGQLHQFRQDAVHGERCGVWDGEKLPVSCIFRWTKKKKLPQLWWRKLENKPCKAFWTKGSSQSYLDSKGRRPDERAMLIMYPASGHRTQKVEDWMLNECQKAGTTAAGNYKHRLYADCLQWVTRSWEKLDTAGVVKKAKKLGMAAEPGPEITGYVDEHKISNLLEELLKWRTPYFARDLPVEE